MTSRDLHAAALALPREERAELAKELLESLGEATDEVDAAWAREVGRRAQEVADGTVELVDWETARERIARRLRERRGGTQTPPRG